MLSARNINDFTIDFDSARLLDEASFAAEDARTQIQAGDVLLTIVGSIGRVAVVPESAPRFTLQRSVAVLKPIGVEARYLAHALATPRLQQWLSENAKGTAQKGVYLKVLGSAEVPIAPAAEQIRIVAKLEELLSDLDAGVAELKAAQAKLQHYRQSLLKAAVEGSLTRAWREAHPAPEETGADLLARILRERRARWEAQQLAKFEAQGKKPPKGWQGSYPEPIQPELAGLPLLPATWSWASLDMLGDIASGVAKGTKRDETAPVREVPYLRVANVQRGFLDLSEVKTILATERDIAALMLRDGDVLFNEGGDRDKLGRGWVWREEVPECIHQNHVFRMRPFIAEINSEFVSHHGNTFGKQWFQSAGKQTTNLASINMGMLRAFPVPVPPVEEQQVIVAQLVSQLERLTQQEASVEKAMQQSTAQRQNLLRAAFAGELVPQDPADEPATLLLERIRAERLQRPKSTKARTPKTRKEVKDMVTRLLDVLAEEADWLPAQEAFRRCGVADGAPTEQIELLYAELRALSKAGQIAVEPLRDEDGRKVGDQLRLLGD
jgi:type I restriction enzyme S subunit